MQNDLSDVEFKTFEEVQKRVDDFFVSQDETFFGEASVNCPYDG